MEALTGNVKIVKADYIKDQIDFLNKTVKCKLGISKIHNIGVFAIRNIEKGEKLYCLEELKRHGLYSVPYSRFNEILPEIRTLILEHRPAVINGSKFYSPNNEANFCSYMNHSRNPNWNQDDMALKDIKSGEEITQDYRGMINAENVFDFL